MWSASPALRTGPGKLAGAFFVHLMIADASLMRLLRKTAKK
jgi:hypothetical protein